MFKTIDDIMYMTDGNNPFREGLLYGRGGLGYKPTPYNMVGGTIFTYDDNGNIIDARPYNEDDKEKIIKQGTVDYDLNKLQEHVNYFKLLPEEDKEEKEQVLKDMNFLYDVNDKTINGIVGLSNVIVKEENKDVYLDKMIKRIEKEIEDKKVEKLQAPAFIHKRIDKEISGMNDTLKLYMKDRDDSRDAIKDVANEITKILTKEQISELPKKEYYDYMNRLYLNSKNTEGITKEEKDIIESDNKKLKKVIRTLKKEHKTKEIEEPEENKYITKGEFNVAVKPSGGGEAVENVIVENEDISSEIYNKLKLSFNNIGLMSLQDFIGHSDKRLPIDLTDPENKILMEIKKYQKYNFQKFKEQLYNEELPTLKKIFLEDLLSIPKVDPRNKISNEQSLDNYNKKMDILRNFTDDNGIIDDEKMKAYLHKNYKGISIPIGIQKFGDINENKIDETISKNDIENTINSLNKDWDIKIDYNPRSKNYGKVIELDKKNGQYKDKTKDIKNFDLVFTIALADELLTFNYSKYVRDNKILSPLNAFRLGNDFYEKDDKLSYMIPVELFERTDKTKYIEPKIKNIKNFSSIINEINEGNIPEDKKFYAKKIQETNKEDLDEIKTLYDEVKDKEADLIIFLMTYGIDAIHMTTKQRLNLKNIDTIVDNLKKEENGSYYIETEGKKKNKPVKQYFSTKKEARDFLRPKFEKIVKSIEDPSDNYNELINNLHIKLNK